MLIFARQFFPLVMNAFQYYIIDSFIKARDPTQSFIRDGAPIDDEPELHHPRRSFNYIGASDSDGEDGSKDLLYPARPTPRAPKKPNQHIEEYDPDYDGSSEHRESPESGYFGRHGRNGRKAPTVGSQKSRNSSMMLLPGSRGPSTPGYADEEQSIGGRNGARTSTFADDESTLVGRESDR
jgi:hypothetical protein